MRRTLSSLALVTVLVAPASAASINVPLDEVRLITFAKPVATVYVGNPTIADINMIDTRRAFVLGTVDELFDDDPGIPAAAFLGTREHRAESAHPSVYSVEPNRQAVPLCTCHPAPSIVEQGEAMKILAAPPGAHLRGVPLRVPGSRQTFVPKRKRRLDNLLEQFTFRDYKLHPTPNLQLPTPNLQLPTYLLSVL